jgi:hypothetical protein
VTVLLRFYSRYRSHDLLDSLGFNQRAPTNVHVDNNACIKWGNSVIGGRERAKRIDIHEHLALEAIHYGHMLLVRVPTAYQLADMLTKGLHAPQWRACVESRSLTSLASTRKASSGLG